MMKQRKVLPALLMVLFLVSTINMSAAVQEIEIGRESYGYVKKIGPYGNGDNKIGIIIGVHPQEGNVREAMFDAIESLGSTLKNQIYIYRIVVTKDADDREKSRIYGENLTNKYVVPDVDKSYSLVMDVHGHRGLYESGKNNFIFAPAKDSASESLGHEIADSINWLDYYYVEGTSPPKVTIPIAQKGIPALIVELYRNIDRGQLENRCGEVIKTIDAIFNTNRLAGNDRYQTAAQISKKGWPNGSNYVIIVRGDDFADALSAGPVASLRGAPILLGASQQQERDNPTSASNIRNTLINEVKRLKATNAIICGGTSAVSQETENALRSQGITTERISGSDRYQTSILSSQKQFKSANAALIVRGDLYPDGLAAGPLASLKNGPILLVPSPALQENSPASSQKIMDNVKAELQRLNVKNVIIAGSDKAISSDVEQQLKNIGIKTTRYAGVSRYETAVELAKAYVSEKPLSCVVIATGSNFPDALASSPFAFKNNGVVLLTQKDSLPTVVKDFLSMYKPEKAYVAGGKSVISDSVIDEIVAIIGT